MRALSNSESYLRRIPQGREKVNVTGCHWRDPWAFLCQTLSRFRRKFQEFCPASLILPGFENSHFLGISILLFSAWFQHFAVEKMVFCIKLNYERSGTNHVMSRKAVMKMRKWIRISCVGIGLFLMVTARASFANERSERGFRSNSDYGGHFDRKPDRKRAFAEKRRYKTDAPREYRRENNSVRIHRERNRHLSREYDKHRDRRYHFGRRYERHYDEPYYGRRQYYGKRYDRRHYGGSHYFGRRFHRFR